MVFSNVLTGNFCKDTPDSYQQGHLVISLSGTNLPHLSPAIYLATGVFLPSYFKPLLQTFQRVLITPECALLLFLLSSLSVAHPFLSQPVPAPAIVPFLSSFMYGLVIEHMNYTAPDLTTFLQL